MPEEKEQSGLDRYFALIDKIESQPEKTPPQSSYFDLLDKLEEEDQNKNKQ